MCSLCHIRDVFRHYFLKSQCFLFVTCLHLLLPLATSLRMHFFVMFSHLFIFVIHIIPLLWFSLFRVSTCAMCFYAKCIFGIHVFIFFRVTVWSLYIRSIICTHVCISLTVPSPNILVCGWCQEQILEKKHEPDHQVAWWTSCYSALYQTNPNPGQLNVRSSVDKDYSDHCACETFKLISY